MLKLRAAALKFGTSRYCEWVTRETEISRSKGGSKQTQFIGVNRFGRHPPTLLPLKNRGSPPPKIAWRQRVRTQPRGAETCETEILVAIKAGVETDHARCDLPSLCLREAWAGAAEGAPGGDEDAPSPCTGSHRLRRLLRHTHAALLWQAGTRSHCRRSASNGCAPTVNLFVMAPKRHGPLRQAG